MAETVSKSAFKPRALEFFRRVEQSREPLVITDHGKPVLKIVPYSEAPADALASLRGTVRRYDRPEDPVGGEDWEALR